MWGIKKLSLVKNVKNKEIIRNIKMNHGICILFSDFLIVEKIKLNGMIHKARVSFMVVPIFSASSP